MIDEKFVLLGSAAGFLLFVLISLSFIGNPSMFFAFLIIAMAVAVIPYSLYKFFEFTLLKNCENEFPNFLRDLAEAKRSGLTMLQALKTCSKSDYGMLTKYIRKMANQLSWNIPFREVLENFRKTFRHSKIINYSVMVISEVEQMGGKIEDILDSLANNIESIKETYEEKKSLMHQHIMTMYAIFFVFLGISVTLIKFLVPLLQAQNQIGYMNLLGNFGSSPCNVCLGSSEPACITCNLFFGICNAFSFGDPSSPKCYYKSLFFLMVVIQGIFSGLIAGQISSDSIIGGVKHSLLMAGSGFAIFVLISFIGVI